MDINNFLPNFDQLSKVDWSKPSINTNDNNRLLSLLGVVLMIVSLFVSWYTIETKLGVGTTSEEAKITAEWYMIIAMIMTIVAAIGSIYNLDSFVSFAGIVSIIMAIIALTSYPEMVIDGITYSGEEVEEQIKEAKEFKLKLEESRTGAILNLIGGSIVTLSTLIRGNNNNVEKVADTPVSNEQ